MANALNVLVVLVGMAGLLAIFIAAAIGTAWCVGLFLRWFPLIGRRHSSGRVVGRDPIETASSKLARPRKPPPGR
jgi:hypothetical protein